MDKLKIENLTSSDNDSDSEVASESSRISPLSGSRLQFPEAVGNIGHIPPANPGADKEHLSDRTNLIVIGSDPTLKIRLPLCELPREEIPVPYTIPDRIISCNPSLRQSHLKPTCIGNAPTKPFISYKPEPNYYPIDESDMQLYEPISTADLAVSKAKVKLLESWMKSALNSKVPNILLLTGPTGSGKTTAVLAIAADLDARVIEWTTPMDEFRDVDENRFQTTSQATKFLDFLLGGSRYQPVIGPSNPRKVILVEDYPNAFLRTPSVFHEVVMKYCEKGRCPLVFITTDGKKKISLDLFPEKLMQSAFIHHMSFNPVADTLMKKAIDRLAVRRKRSHVDSVTCKAICAAAMGDVRSAENIWNFRNSGTSKSELSSASSGTTSRMKRRGAAVELPPKKKVDPCFDSKDPGYEKLHCIGRVLYAKRESAPVKLGSQDRDPRGYLRTDPNSIVSQFLTDRQSFVALVHENYPAIFSGIEHVTQAADHLSFSDVIAPDNRLDLDHLRENSFSIAVRGFMNACTNPITKWFPLKKSKFREVEDSYENFMQKVTQQYGGSPYSLTTAKVDMIPMLHNLEKIHHYDKTETGRHSPIPHITDDSDEDV